MRFTLNGYVVSDDDLWVYEYFDVQAFSPRVIRQALADNPAGEDLVLEINSPGGSVFSGFEMYSVLLGAKCPVVGEIQSLAASAASTLASGCSRVLMSPVAQMMVHLPSVTTEGDQIAHQASIQMLDSVTASIISGYEHKCRGRCTRDKLLQLVENETWLTAKEAVDLGLADGILGESGGISPSQIINSAVCAGLRSFTSCSHYPTPELLRAEYSRLVAEGKAPEHPAAALAGSTPQLTLKDDWRNSARLSIAKSKFREGGAIR